MKRKIILNLAMSLDGFIADLDGGYDWIVGDGAHLLNTKTKFDFKQFLEAVDTVVMGRNCYNQGMHKEYETKKVFVATTKGDQDLDNLSFIKGDIVNTILDERKKGGKDIFLFGGGILLDAFLKADVIDEFIIGVIPVILGKGRPLFLGNSPKVELKLEQYSFEDGIAIMRYSRR